MIASKIEKLLRCECGGGGGGGATTNASQPTVAPSGQSQGTAGNSSPIVSGRGTVVGDNSKVTSGVGANGVTGNSNFTNSGTVLKSDSSIKTGNNSAVTVTTTDNGAVSAALNALQNSAQQSSDQVGAALGTLSTLLSNQTGTAAAATAAGATGTATTADATTGTTGAAVSVGAIAVIGVAVWLFFKKSK